MTNQDILRTATEQSALELGCRAEDFLRTEPLITQAAIHPDARRYLQLPYPAYFVSYGSNVVAAVSPEYTEIVRSYLNSHKQMLCLSPPALSDLADAFAPLGCRPGFASEYWLPELSVLTPLPCAYETRVLGPDALAAYYLPEWSNALCAARPELDELGVGAFDGGRLIGLAGCSADCAAMRQIGVDVLPEYRRQGIAAALTSRLACEIINRGKVPFYACAWCNLPSARNAAKSGFRLAWTELEIVRAVQTGG